MKRGLTLVFAVAVVLIASLVYATQKVKETKPAERRPVTISEEEALQAELLDAVEDIRKKSPDSGGKKNVAAVAKVRIIEKRPEK